MSDDVKPPLSEDQKAALGAIYRDAYRRGHIEGFRADAAEKFWLHQHWPLIMVLGCAASMIVGIVIVGVNAP